MNMRKCFWLASANTIQRSNSSSSTITGGAHGTPKWSAPRLVSSPCILQRSNSSSSTKAGGAPGTPKWATTKTKAGGAPVTPKWAEKDEELAHEYGMWQIVPLDLDSADPTRHPDRVPASACVSASYVHQQLSQFKENVIDVRSRELPHSERLTGTVNIPLSEFKELLKLPIKEITENFHVDITSYDSEFVVFSDAGDSPAAAAWFSAHEAGFKNVKLFRGGKRMYELQTVGVQIFPST